MREPKVNVGIMFEHRIDFVLHGCFLWNERSFDGAQSVSFDDGKIYWNGSVYNELIFVPLDDKIGSFELVDVTIGINFHWERKENQRFKGALKFIVENNKLTAINVISVEDYLISVISSEMSATASAELLKAHAVISRSWLLAQIQKNKEIEDSKTTYSAFSETADECVKWYDREDHINFDVCADDHCQRYQGITRATTPNVEKAVNDTAGQVLMWNGRICDARFSKCCGGAVEEFQYCWEDVKHPYLVKLRDDNSGNELPDLTSENESIKWIYASPDAFCNTTDKKILSQVLNNYDQETNNFYRWEVTYSQKELSRLILQRSGVDYGEIVDILPIERGVSARLVRVKIVGTKQTRIIGKELEIRRTLSKSHLYSSAFVVEKSDLENGIPQKIKLIGAGWGHGVGLCQIGAAVMGEQGFKYDQILLHYYVGAQINNLY